MIMRGGENIYRKVIEEFLYTHENIKEVSVFRYSRRKNGRTGLRLDSNARQL
tara:strand:+ start:35716 stop:35871 length:156 start_codon:yes stop_codon:yes gene_type:complete